MKCSKIVEFGKFCGLSDTLKKCDYYNKETEQCENKFYINSMKEILGKQNEIVREVS